MVPKNKKENNLHLFLRQNNWMTRNSIVAGNFNLTNVNEELFDIFGEYEASIQKLFPMQLQSLKKSDIF